MMTAGEQVSEQERKLTLELRRGAVALAAMAALRAPSYGYSLQQRLSEAGFEVDQGTLYPLLRRLDKQGLLESDWNVDGSRPRKYYTLSAEGHATLNALRGQWDHLVEVLGGLFENSTGDSE